MKGKRILKKENEDRYDNCSLQHSVMKQVAQIFFPNNSTARRNIKIKICPIDGFDLVQCYLEKIVKM